MRYSRILFCWSAVFLEQTRDDEADVLAVDQDLGEALVDAAHAVGDVLEAHAVEDGFLEHRPRSGTSEVLVTSPIWTQDGQILHQLVIAAGLQVLRETHRLPAAPWSGIPRERGHHLLEGVLCC